MREAVASGSAFVAPKRIREIITRWSANPRNAPASTTPLADDTNSPASPDDTIEDVRLPGGASGSAGRTAVMTSLPTTAESTTPLLAVEHLHKRFGNVHALDDVSLLVPAGQVTALAGDNGLDAASGGGAGRCVAAAKHSGRSRGSVWLQPRSSRLARLRRASNPHSPSPPFLAVRYCCGQRAGLDE